MKKLLRVRTVILSDVHLGTAESKAAEVNHFLRHVRCEKLILNGDIIDGWALQRGGSWTKAHTRFIRIVLKKLEKKDTQVVYLRGNHDDILAQFLPLDFENLTIVEDHVHEGPGGRYLVLHGDVFDTVTKNFVWLAHLGDWGYRALLKLRDEGTIRAFGAGVNEWEPCRWLMDRGDFDIFLLAGEYSLLIEIDDELLLSTSITVSG